MGSVFSRYWATALVVLVSGGFLGGCDEGHCVCVDLLIAGSPAAEPEEFELASHINDYRILHERRAIQLSPTLFAAAHRHAQDMAAQEFSSHLGSDGSTVQDRALEAGYVGQVGENIFASRSCGYGGASCVIHAWDASGGHRDNMLSSQYRAIGVGLYGAVAVVVLGTELPENPL